MNDEVILQDVKKLIGPSEIYDQFNKDLIIHINSVFNTLQQLGVGPKNGFCITEDGNETWADFFGDIEQPSIFIMVKSYMYLKVRLQFDPPSGSVLDAFKEQAKEYEWRLREATEIDWEKE